MDSILDFLATDFANDFPQFVDHYEGDKPIFNQFGSIVFSFCVVKIVTAFISRIVKPED